MTMGAASGVALRMLLFLLPIGCPTTAGWFSPVVPLWLCLHVPRQTLEDFDCSYNVIVELPPSFSELVSLSRFTGNYNRCRGGAAWPCGLQ